MESGRHPVTHVFTDIEGSSRLWDSEPERMAAAHAQHDALARRVVIGHSGRLVKTTGDGWHAAFADPADALRAAYDFQVKLLRVAHEAGIALRARCGVHTAVADVRDGDYFGPAINRAARIMNAAHGGQVLVSQATAELVSTGLPDGLVLRELGRVRLRDLGGTEGVYQLVHPALPQEFPPLRGIDATPNNLPFVASSFVGRREVLAELREALASHRLVTIVGPGGIGKTRVALQLAAEVFDCFEDGVWLVELARTTDVSRVPEAVAQALGVAEQPGHPLAESLVAFLAKRRSLVVLDNCEHVLAVCASLADMLLRSSQEVRILATSRESLHVDGEHVCVLPGLIAPAVAVSAITNEVMRSPAIELFVDRARAQAPGFTLTRNNAPTIAHICRSLDGMPLAIELAAARVRSLALDDIEQRLDDRFRLLTGGYRALERHRTLEALVTWSYDLLDTRERTLFERLGVFVGGFDLEAAEAVGSAPPVERDGVATLVGSLVEKSLVVADANEDARRLRYQMLETLRIFALRHLEARGETAVTRTRHAQHYVRLAQALPEATNGEARRRHLERMDVEHDNLRGALGWRMAEPDTGEAAAELALAMAEFWYVRGHASEAARSLDAVFALPVGACGSLCRGRLAIEACRFAGIQTRYADSRRYGEMALTDCRACGTAKDVAAALCNLAQIAGRQRDFDTADRLSRESLRISRAEGDRLNEAKTLLSLSTTWMLAGEFERARATAEQAVAVARIVGDLGIQTHAEFRLASCYLAFDHPVEARVHYEQLLPLARTIGDRNIEAMGRGGLGEVELALGNVDASHASSLELLDYVVASDSRQDAACVLDDIAHALAMRGQPTTAAQLFAAAEKERVRCGVVLSQPERAQLDRRIADARRAAGDDAFARAWIDGEEMSLQNAVRLARTTPLPSGGAESASTLTTRS